MLGSIDNHVKNVSVIGGGISGLLASYQLIKQGYNVTLYESTQRLGGLISTKKTQHGLVELAAHSILMNDCVKSFFLEIGVSIQSKKEDCKARYIYRDGQFRRFPLNLFELIRAIFGFMFIKVPFSQPTFAQFGETIFGKAVVRYLFHPFLAGIYGAIPSAIKVRLAFPEIPIQEGQTLLRSFLRGKRSKKSPSEMVAIQGGMESLIQKLEEFILKNAVVKLGVEVSSTLYQEIQSDGNVVITVPAYELNNIIPELSSFASIPYSPLTTATVFTEKDGNRTKQGVGVLLAEGEELNSKYGLLGVLFNSDSFLHRVNMSDVESFTVMFNKDVSSLDIRASLKDCLGIPEKSILAIHSQFWSRAIPVYGQELENFLGQSSHFLKSKKGIMFFGNYTGKVSIRGLIESLNLFEPYIH